MVKETITDSRVSTETITDTEEELISVLSFGLSVSSGVSNSHKQMWILKT